MTFLFNCEDEILLPRAYDLIDELKGFIELMKKTEISESDISENKSENAKFIIKNLMKEHPKETSEMLKKFWVLDKGEKSPNALKTMSEFFTNETAMNFFTSALPSLLQISNIYLNK